MDNGIYFLVCYSMKCSGDRGRLSSAGIFVGGFVLGGIVVGTLGCVYAPQVMLQ